MTTLTDFTSDELAFAIIAVKESQAQAIHSLAKHEVIGTNPEHEQVKFWERQAEIAVTWLAQLQTAMQIVKHNETINQN